MAKLVLGNDKTKVTPAIVIGGGGSGTPQPNTKKRTFNLEGTNILFNDGSELIDLTGVDKIDNWVLSHAYYGCDITPTVSFTRPLVVNEDGMFYMFYQCHFVDPDVDVSGITSVGHQGCQYMFAGSDVESVDISGITTVGQTSLYAMFQGCSHLVSVNMFNVKEITITGSCQYMFQNCTSLLSADMSSIETVSSSSGINAMYDGCTSLTTADVSYIRKVGPFTNAISSLFRNTALTKISWPSLRETVGFGASANAYAFKDCNYLTEIHFPANIQSTIQSLTGYSAQWGAPNATVYFDLPSSFELIGADGNTYYRNPKYDTVTALSWFDVNVGRATPYYTSGTTDPAVSDTIYSDSACTTPATTIDSIS